MGLTNEASKGSESELVMLFAEVRRLHLQPGDVVVLRTLGVLPSRETLDEVIRRLQETFPGHKCVVLHSDFDIGVMRPE